VIDAALPPLSPIRPRTTLDIAIGLLIGIILGAMLAFVQRALDSSLKNPEDAELLIAAPALASIPAEAQTRAARLLPANGSKRLKGNDQRTQHGIALLQDTTVRSV